VQGKKRGGVSLTLAKMTSEQWRAHLGCSSDPQRSCQRIQRSGSA
jgi:hypothetical protein